MVVYQLTQAQFLACPQGPIVQSTMYFFDLYPDFTWVKGAEIPLACNPNYATAPVQQQPLTFAEQLLLERQPDEWAIVGGYIGIHILIEPRVRGKRLSGELILRCAEHRPVPADRILSEDGYGALRSAHEKAVRAAVAAGLTVPAAVRVEYGL